MTPLVYLDLDGVITDFDKAYKPFEPCQDVPNKFRKAVLEHQIFTKLDWMLNGKNFLRLVLDLTKEYDFEVQILTSLGTRDEEVSAAVLQQKTAWLEDNHVHIKPNFVKSRIYKKDFCQPHTIMIDDMLDVVDGFRLNGGKGIYYHDNMYELHFSQLLSYLESYYVEQTS